MAQLDNALKMRLEKLFGMSTGYVLDFTNYSFADFVQTSVGFDPYERYGGSKASVLRSLWQHESSGVVKKLGLELLEYWRTSKLMAEETITPSETILYDEAKQALSTFDGNQATPSDLAFLEKDFSGLDLASLQVELTSRQVVEQRLDEIDKCIEAQAPLAVIFLCGSTLEGLLNEVAAAHLQAFMTSPGAPQRQGSARPLSEWTLANLITVARAQGVIGEDVVKHAGALRDFRNYIHPRQQIRENFTPRMFTAQMARHVLLAALADLGSSGGE